MINKKILTIIGALSLLAVLLATTLIWQLKSAKHEFNPEIYNLTSLQSCEANLVVEPLLACQTLTLDKTNYNGTEDIRVTITKNSNGSANSYAAIEVRDNNNKMEIGTPITQFNGGTSAVIIFSASTLAQGNYTIKGQICEPAHETIDGTMIGTTCSPIYSDSIPCKANFTIIGNQNPIIPLSCSAMTPATLSVADGARAEFNVSKPTDLTGADLYATVQVVDQAGFIRDIGTPITYYTTANTVKVSFPTTSLGTGTYTVKGQVCRESLNGNNTCSSVANLTSCLSTLTVTNSHAVALTCASMTPTSKQTINGGAEVAYFVNRPTGLTGTIYATVQVIDQTGLTHDIGTPLTYYSGTNTTAKVTFPTSSLSNGTYTVKGQVCKESLDGNNTCSSVFATSCLGSLEVTGNAQAVPLACTSMTPATQTINGGNNATYSITKPAGLTGTLYATVQVVDQNGITKNIGTPISSFGDTLNTVSVTFPTSSLSNDTYKVKGQVCRESSTGNNTCSPVAVTPCLGNLTITNSPGVPLACNSMTPNQLNVVRGNNYVNFTVRKNSDLTGNLYATLQVFDSQGVAKDVHTPMTVFGSNNAVNVRFLANLLPVGIYTIKGQVCRNGEDDVNDLCSPATETSCIANLNITSGTVPPPTADPTFDCDLDNNNQINLDDFYYFSNLNYCPVRLTGHDFNNDGVVNMLDYNLFKTNCRTQISCTPNCTGKVCGSDSCGGSCGTCSTNQACNSSGQCINSTNPVCGNGSCESGETTATCPADCPATCTPNCTDKVCGPDGCGGSCGTCSLGMTCNGDGKCYLNKTALTCPLSNIFMNTSNSVKFTWTKVEGATSYRVYRNSQYKDVGDVDNYIWQWLPTNNTSLYKVAPVASDGTIKTDCPAVGISL